MGLTFLTKFCPELSLAQDGLVSILTLVIADNPLTMVDAGNSEGKTALMIASERGDLASVRFLLDAGADISLVDSRSENSFYKAVQAEHGPVIEHILDTMAHKINLDQSLFHMAAAKCLHRSVEMILQRSEFRLNLNRVDPSGQTPLMLAASNGCVQVVKTLLNMGSSAVDINARSTDDGTTALSIAARNGRVDITQTLLSQPDVDVNSRDNCNQTALHEACKSLKDNDHTVRLLLQTDGIRYQGRS